MFQEFDLINWLAVTVEDESLPMAAVRFSSTA